MTRRDYLKLQLAGTFLFYTDFSFAREEEVLFASSAYRLVNDQKAYGLAYGAFDHSHLEFLNLGFSPHYVVQSPTNPNLGVVFQRRGPHAAVVDLKRVSVLNAIELPQGLNFYGHGDFFADGQRILFTTIPADPAAPAKGTQLFEYHLQRKKLAPPHFVSCGFAHDIQNVGLKDEFRLCYNPLRGQPGGIGTYVIGESHLKDQRAFSPNQSPGHFVVERNGRMVTLVNYSEGDSPAGMGAIFITDLQQKILAQNDLKISSPAGGVRNEVLSIAVDSKDQWVCMTAPGANKCFLYDLSNRRIAAEISLESPYGVFFNRITRQFEVTCLRHVVSITPSAMKPKLLQKPLPGNLHFLWHSSVLRPFA